MKIVLATPLYPPDIAEPAPYIKELAKRLSATYAITIVTYGRLPEKVDGVMIVEVSKRKLLPMRLALYTLALMQAARDADVIYAQNGPSVEMPVAIINFFMRRPLIAHWGDERAHTYAHKHRLRRWIERAAFRRAIFARETPPPRPEILPFEPAPTAALAAWEAAWVQHTNELKNIFTHA